MKFMYDAAVRLDLELFMENDNGETFQIYKVVSPVLRHLYMYDADVFVYEYSSRVNMAENRGDSLSTRAHVPATRLP